MTQIAPQDPLSAASQPVESQPSNTLLLPLVPGAGQEGSPQAGTPIPGPNDPGHQAAIIAGIFAGDRYDTGPQFPEMHVQPSQDTPSASSPDASLQSMTTRTLSNYDPSNSMNNQMGLLEGGRIQGPAPATGGGDRVLQIAKSYFGIPYQYGANGPNAYDCSSFVQHVYGQMGITLPRVTYDQVNTGQAIMDSSQLQPGDLLFFWGDGNRRNGHVGIFVGGNTMIDEPHTGSSVGYRSVNWGQVTAMRRVL